MKRVATIGALLITLGISLNVVGLPVKAESSPDAVVVAPELSPYFKGMSERLGLTGTGKRVFALSNPTCVPTLPEGQQGVYYLGKISILAPCLNDTTHTVTVAHEYLHAVWERTPVEQKALITQDLKTFYTTHAYQVAPRFTTYRNHNFTEEQLVNEYHSIFGTEINDADLPPRLRGWYAHWLPNRSVLPSLCCSGNAR